jgi:hypothetical protein
MDPRRLDDLLDAQCALLGLGLAAEHRPGVIRYLQLARDLAALVMDFPLEPADEPGTVFVPVTPRHRRVEDA